MSENNMLAYIMIAISLALIIGSWMWLAPSVRQNQLAKLRQNALLAGFRAKFVKKESYLEFAQPYSKKQIIPDTQIVRYTFTNPESKQASLKNPEQKLLFLFNADGTLLAFTVNTQETPLSYLNDFGIQISTLERLSKVFQGLLAIELSGQKGRRSLSIYWQEEGELDQVKFNSDDLQTLKTV